MQYDDIDVPLEACPDAIFFLVLLLATQPLTIHPPATNNQSTEYPALSSMPLLSPVSFVSTVNGDEGFFQCPFSVGSSSIRLTIIIGAIFWCLFALTPLSRDFMAMDYIMGSRYASAMCVYITSITRTPTLMLPPTLTLASRPPAGRL